MYIDGMEQVLSRVQDSDAPRLGKYFIPVLLYADDIVILSLSSEGLQLLLGALSQFCQERGLTVNLEKTKVMRFSASTDAMPPIMYEGSVIEHVSCFQYLGIVFQERYGLSRAPEQLLQAGRKALFACRRRCAELCITDPKLLCRLFDALVYPVLSYACEVWALIGTNERLNKLEQLHLQFLKSVLGVGPCTPSLMVYAELGRAPLRHRWAAQSAKFWNWAMDLGEERLVRVAMLSCLHRGQGGATRGSWTAGLETWLRSARVLSAPPLQHTDRVDINQLKNNSLEDMSRQLHSPRADQTKLQLYASFKIDMHYESYLSIIRNVSQRRILSQFRLGSHWLEVEKGRHSAVVVARENRICKICSGNAVEDEEHFLFYCPAFAALRTKFADLLEDPTVIVQLQGLLQSGHHIRLARFITECRNFRTNCLNTARRF
jgi:hypothetical protein